LLAGCGSEGTIGAVLGQKPDGRLFIRDAPVPLAASRVGLEPGDEILLVNGRDVRTLDASVLHRVLEGDVGDPVRLTVLHGEEVRRVTLRLTPAPPARPNREETR
jgi:C-terminal processing protease CtpA/Prc